MMQKILASLFSIALSLTAAGNALADAGGESLKMGVVPFKSPRAVMELYVPVANWLAKSLAMDVQVVTAKGYEQYMNRVYAEQYDIIVLGSTFYFKAHDRAGYKPVVRGYPPFYAGIIVATDSDITAVDQLRGKSMAAVNSRDRGGYTLQKMALAKKGIDIEQELDVHFRGDFDSVIYAVLSGQDDAGAIRLDALQKPSFAGIRQKFRIIYTSPENPQFPFAVRSGISPERQEKITAALCAITMENKETAPILQGLNIQGIERISGSDLETLRRVRQEEAGKTVKP
jgi:phosphonate transport system substrate-binding protein